MSTEYTKTNWQDGDIITADKMNNIENGIKGIEDVTTTVKDGLSETVDNQNITFTSGGYIYTAGTPGTTIVDLTPRSSASFTYAIVDAKSGDNFCINGTGVQNAYLWTFIDSNNKMLTRAAINAEGVNLIITAPENASKLIINSSVAGVGTCYQLSAVNNAVANVDVIGNSAKHRIVAGVVRNSGNGWEFIIDANHQGDLNCLSVSADNTGRLVIDYSGINATKVISFMIQPDEAFANRGYICGSSVGKTAAYVDIYKYAPLGVYGFIEAKNDGTLTVGDGSIGINSVSWNDTYGRMIIQHDDVGASLSVPTVTPCLYANTMPRLYSRTSSSTTLEFMKSDGTKVMEVNGSISVAIQRFDPTQLKLVKQNASEIVSSNGNFWFMGIFEV